MTTGRRWRATLSVVALVVLLSPVVTDRDSFPLSTYPMYAHDRDDTARFLTAEGVTRNGDRARLSLGSIADTDDPLVAQGRLRDAARRGELDAICVEVAARVAQVDRPDRPIERIEVVDLEIDLRSDDEVERVVLAGCDLVIS